MSEETLIRFKHRRKEDGTHDSICLACLTTISTHEIEARLEREEEDHVCRFSFPARRSGGVRPGGLPGRRKSDIQWKQLESREDSAA